MRLTILGILAISLMAVIVNALATEFIYMDYSEPDTEELDVYTYYEHGCSCTCEGY